jgi:hypothetical protein
MIYTFAIALAPVPELKPMGISQAIAYVQVGDLVAVVEFGLDVQALKSSPEPVLIQAVVNHDRLICELFSHHTLLPLRFGTAFVSEPALQDYLSAQHQVLSDRLHSLQGYAEYLVKATVSYPKPVEAQTNLKGKDYLLAKRSQYLQQQQVQQQQQQEYDTLLAKIKLEDTIKIELAPPQTGETLRAYILATAIEIKQFQQTLANLKVDFPHWQVEISDRLPIYHFTKIN